PEIMQFKASQRLINPNVSVPASLDASRRRFMKRRLGKDGANIHHKNDTSDDEIGQKIDDTPNKIIKFTDENQDSAVVKQDKKLFTSSDFSVNDYKHEQALVNYRAQLSECPENVYMDCLNGAARRRILEQILALSMYTDGLKLASSSSNEIWILGFTLSDLPLKIRFARQNFVYGAAWIGSSKPPWQLFSKDICNQLNDGIIIQNKFNVFKILQINADIPARATLINCKQGGYCPCVRCHIVGVKNGSYIQFDNRNFQTVTPPIYRKMLQHFIDGNCNKNSCIKGKSAFSEILRIPECVTGDIMHTGYYGPLRDNLTGVLKNKTIAKKFDDTINKLNLPIELSNRKLRDTSEANLYKASEWKAVLFYLSVIVLPDFIVENNMTGKNREEKFNIQKKKIVNILQGIAALECLMQDIVTETMIQHSEILLTHWFDGRKNLFGDNEYTQKAHEMMHFPNQVRIHGPLQGSSCFGGENVLQSIKNMVTCLTPQVILKQISERISQTNEISKWKNENSSSEMGSLIHSITKSKTGNSNKVVIPPEILSDIYGDGNIMETSGPHSLEISGFTYFAIGESTSRYTNSLCYFKDLGITN
uniref:Uncharacterized protein n=1 Tax=Panagrolaimus sp. ES5 TaxID=591445 RepID=A0AC34G5C7_9BILA